MKKALIMAGGTGGHIFPALAIARALKQRGWEIHWLGTAKGMEARLVPNHGFPLQTIPIQGLRGKSKLSLLLAPWRIMHAVWAAGRFIQQYKPDVVIGMGGFAAGPGGIAAWLLRKPLLIHEQNAIAGMTNRWLGKVAQRVLSAFPKTFPEAYQTRIVGNPLRAEILAVPMQERPRQPLRILVFGGSLGAQALNEQVPTALMGLSTALSVWHQTGEKHIDSMQQAYQDAEFEVKLTAFIDDMAAAYQWADLVICRAGALTVSEIAQAGVASVLVPFPHAVDDHQTRNGQYLVEQGAAVLLQQTELEQLSIKLQEMIADSQRLQQMAHAAKQCAKPDAVEKIVEEIERL